MRNGRLLAAGILAGFFVLAFTFALLVSRSLQRQIDAFLPPGARDRGIVIHGAIGEFTERYRERLPDDMIGELLALGSKHFAVLEDFPEARAFWWPRFVRIAHWFAQFETGRRPLVAKLGAELRGKLDDPARRARVHTDRTRGSD